MLWAHGTHGVCRCGSRKPRQAGWDGMPQTGPSLQEHQTHTCTQRMSDFKKRLCTYLQSWQVPAQYPMCPPLCTFMHVHERFIGSRYVHSRCFDIGSVIYTPYGPARNCAGLMLAHAFLSAGLINACLRFDGLEAGTCLVCRKNTLQYRSCVVSKFGYPAQSVT